MNPIPGLEAVAWASLHGTRGSADDVPAQIEALRSVDRDVGHAALSDLWDAVFHQGTRWQVSAYVVPFLILLIDDPVTPERAAILDLVRAIGVGWRSDDDLPFDPHEEFSRFSAATVTAEQEAIVRERIYYLEQEFTEDAMHIVNACAVKWEADAYWATAAHIDAYRRWIADDDPELASRAAELLAWFSPSKATVAALISADGDSAVRASANLALAHIDVPPDAVARRLNSLLDDESFVVRITAAVGLAYRVGRDLPDAALDILIDTKEREPLPEFPPGWRQRAQRGFVALALQRLGLV